MIRTDCLAIDGGRPVIAEPLPTGVSGPSVMGEEEIAAVAEVIRSGRLFVYPRGESVTAEFEAAACRFLGVDHALMVNSGTSALTAGLIAVGVGPGDEVIIPGYTYVATAAAVLAAGAVPVIAEVDQSLGLDPEDFERHITPQTRAVIPVHMRGIPVRLARILEIAEAHAITVVEDACQCVGGTYRGRPVGTYGKVAAWSLNYFKTISTGEGGCFTQTTATSGNGRRWRPIPDCHSGKARKPGATTPSRARPTGPAKSWPRSRWCSSGA